MKRLSKTTLTLLILFAVVVVIRLLAPFGVHRYVEHQMNKIPGYRTSVADVDINLFKGGYTLHGVRIEKANGAVPEPLFETERVESWTQWGAWAEGKPVGLTRLHHPVFTFVLADDEAHSQMGIDSRWLAQVDSLSPLAPNHSEIIDGTLRVIDKHPNRPVTFFINNIQSTTRNLANAEGLEDSLWSTTEMTGSPMGKGAMTTHLRLNGLSPYPSFEMDTAIDNLPLNTFNDFLRAYARIDVEQGTLTSRTHVVGKDGRFTAYTKPRYEGLKTVSLEKDMAEEGVLGVLKEGIAGLAATLTDQDDPSDPDDGITLRLSGVVNAHELRLDPESSLRRQFIDSLTPGSN
ncbi:DUF748 domain-containing protein [Pseudomonas duriflava]|nr:DUF748 domain-containing protein [Pseudomonas duriflava]